MLTQRDHYPMPPDALNPVTNPDLDRVWLETIQFYSTDDTAFHIPHESGLEETPCQFAPLFVCKKKKKFFPPPCPECGGAMGLCKDDSRLKAYGLSPYSTSLKRFLYCPACHSTGTDQTFYQFSLSPDDQGFLKDRFDLIRDFNKLRGTVENFPCLECPEHSSCYITGEKAVSRIDFLSFYPFYMLLFDAAPIKAVDFIPLLSARPFESLSPFPETDFGNDSGLSPGPPGEELFFFRTESRIFLEILYLKLSLLENIARAVCKRVADETTLIRLSAHSIWITPAPAGNSLPFFWNFKVHIIDLISNTPKIPIGFSLSGNRNFNFMACLWFYTLLVNRHQGPGEVYQRIEALSAQGSPEACFSDYHTMVQNFPELALENIFWEPHDVAAPEPWKQFWLRSLHICTQILKQGKTAPLKNCLDHLLHQTGSLKQEIKKELFSTCSPAPARELEKPVAPADKGIPARPEKQAITELLRQLKTKWAQENTGIGDGEEDVLETIVLSSPAVPAQSQFNEDTGTGHETAPPPDQGGHGFEAIEKTMIIGDTAPPPDSENEFDDMEETVVISPQQTRQRETDLSGDEDDLEKTVIIPPKPRQ